MRKEFALFPSSCTISNCSNLLGVWDAGSQVSFRTHEKSLWCKILLRLFIPVPKRALKYFRNPEKLYLLCFGIPYSNQKLRTTKAYSYTRRVGEGESTLVNHLYARIWCSCIKQHLTTYVVQCRIFAAKEEACAVWKATLENIWPLVFVAAATRGRLLYLSFTPYSWFLYLCIYFALVVQLNNKWNILTFTFMVIVSSIFSFRGKVDIVGVRKKKKGTRKLKFLVSWFASRFFYDPLQEESSAVADDWNSSGLPPTRKYLFTLFYSLFP